MYFKPRISNEEDSKFHCENKIFISTKDSVNAREALKNLKVRIANGDFAEGTVFNVVCGTHHAKKDQKVQLGEIDPGLLQFYYLVFSQLKNFCGDLECTSCKKLNMKKCKSSIWDEMKFECEIVPIFSEKIPGDGSNYELSALSKDDLTRLSKKLCNQSRPSMLMFASCYSYFSDITDVLRGNGVVAALNIIKDKGDISQGRLFQLDSKQEQIIQTFAKVLFYILRMRQIKLLCKFCYRKNIKT